MLFGMVTASASTGSIINPLITLSYLNGAFKDALASDSAKMLGDAADNAMSRLDEIYRDYIGYRFAPRYMRVSLDPDDTVALSSGGSFILLSGAADLTLISGAVVNVSTGSEVQSGSPLTLYQRYFCTENTTAIIKASDATTGQVDGYYFVEGAGETAAQNPFSDVSESAWYYAAVDFVYKNGLFAGTSTDTFSPGLPMTRGMFVTVLYRLAGIPEAGQDGGFADVADPSLYYYNAVTWANANNIVTGYTDGTFQPDKAVTREEMAAIMYRYAAYKGGDMTTDSEVYDTYPDTDKVSSYAADALRWAVSQEIIRGSNGGLLPKNTATRAEVAQIIYNYCQTVS